MTIQSENINELMAALAKAQSEMSHAVKDSNNPYFKSKYADLPSVWEACRGPLTRNGLAVTQTLSHDGERTILNTILGHSSGQWIRSAMVLPVQKPGPQEIGSCITYCRRYSLAAIVGMCQDDDDGEAAQAPYRDAEGAISKDELKIMKDLIKKMRNAEHMETFVCKTAKVDSLEKFPKYKFKDAVEYLQKQLTGVQHAGAA